MSHNAYKLAVIHQDQLLREAADWRLARELAAGRGAPNEAPNRRPHRLPGLRWRFRTSQAIPRLTARGR
jgi:hypothetical protein